MMMNHWKCILKTIFTLTNGEKSDVLNSSLVLQIQLQLHDRLVLMAHENFLMPSEAEL